MNKYIFTYIAKRRKHLRNKYVTLTQSVNANRIESAINLFKTFEDDYIKVMNIERVSDDEYDQYIDKLNKEV